MARPASVDDYLAALPPERRDRLEGLRRIVREVAPDADEVISYNMPAFRLDGRFFVSFDAFKRHDSLFPASEGVVAELGEEIRPYLAGRGTIRFSADKPLPLDAIRKVIAIRVREHRGARPSRRTPGSEGSRQRAGSASHGKEGARNG